MADLIRPTASDADELAGALIERFGSLAAVVSARPLQLREILKREPAALQRLKLFRRAELHMRRRTIVGRQMLGNWPALLDYLDAAQAHSPVEIVRVLFLTTRNVLIRDEVMATGSIDQAPLYVREIVKRALELHAAAIIVVHNHPSGDPKPSRADIETTRLLIAAGKTLGVAVHDHVVVASAGHASMKGLGLI